jgi:hypothetical protein
LNEINAPVIRIPNVSDTARVSAQPAVLRSRLRLVEPNAHGSIWFCSHCGERFDASSPNHIPRVCPTCELGLLLQTDTGSAPEPDDAFMIVDSSLSVQAVSARAESQLGICELQAVNRHVMELLIPGDTEASASSLAVAITRAAGGDAAEGRVGVRPSHTFGVRMLARISACGPPRAALVVLDQPTGAN